MQNEAALKSDVVLNMFHNALTKAIITDLELLKHPNVLYRISAYINRSYIWQRSLTFLIKGE